MDCCSRCDEVGDDVSNLAAVISICNKEAIRICVMEYAPFKDRGPCAGLTTE